MKSVLSIGSLKRDDFYQHYHERSSVETTFHMIKSKFGGALRSNTFTADPSSYELGLTHFLGRMTIYSKSPCRLLRDETNSRLFGQTLQLNIPFNHNILYFSIDTCLFLE